MYSFLILVFICLEWSPALGSDNNYGLPSGFYNNNLFRNGSSDIGDILFSKKFYFDYNHGETVFGRHGYKFGFDDGNPVKLLDVAHPTSYVHGMIERPCQAYDTFCIRKFFAEHSRCKISGRRLPDPFFRAQTTLFYPSANISVTCNNVLYRGLNNARVEEFYINKVTDNLVIAIYFDDVSLDTREANLKFNLRGREPEVHQDYGSLEFLQFSVTFVIPGLNDLRLDRAEIHAYLDNPLAPFNIGPKLAVTTDPEVLAMFIYLATVGVDLEHKEEMSPEGVFFGTNYIQYNICDFGLKLL